MSRFVIGLTGGIASGKSAVEGFFRQHGVFVADIQRMPRLIAKLFAVPAMQSYNYRVMLDRDARIAPRYPAPVDKVLWLQLKDGKLIAQHEYDNAAELRQALEQVQP